MHTSVPDLYKMSHKVFQLSFTIAETLLSVLCHLSRQVAPVAVLVLNDHVVVLRPSTVVPHNVLVGPQHCMGIHLLQGCRPVGRRGGGAHDSVRGYGTAVSEGVAFRLTAFTVCKNPTQPNPIQFNPIQAMGRLVSQQHCGKWKYVCT